MDKKLEIRSSESETNSNAPSSNASNEDATAKTGKAATRFGLPHSDFGFVSDFGFRDSSFIDTRR
jgi:hypothetical protein